MRARISEILLAEVIATRKTVLRQRCSRELVAISSKGSPISFERIRFKSQGGRGSLICRKVFSRPLRKRITISCENTDLLSTFGWNAEMAARWTFKEEKAMPCSFNDKR